MAKDRAQNPATAHLKSQKAASIKKSKSQLQQQRVEKLARRNPDRLQKQIDELQRLKEAQGGKLRAKDEEVLAGLERDLRGVKKAREIRGEEEDHIGRDRSKGNDPRTGGHRVRGGGGTYLGKRRRDDAHEGSADSTDTDPEVRDIPMPGDTPPPLPPKRVRDQARKRGAGPSLNPEDDPDSLEKYSVPAPKLPRTIYSSAPQIRDLQKEATNKFIPTAVKARLQKQQKANNGEYRLPEPEDVDAQEDKSKGEQRRIEDEERVFQRELEEEQVDKELNFASVDELPVNDFTRYESGQRLFQPITEARRAGHDNTELLDTDDGVPGAATRNHRVEIEDADDEDG